MSEGTLRKRARARADRAQRVGIERKRHRKRTRREQFLADMNRVVPWGPLVDLIAPVYPKGEGAGRPGRLPGAAGLALGFVSTRAFEAATIVIGIVSLLAVVSIRQAGPAAGTDDASLIAVGQGLVGVRDWTFIIGPSLMPGFNALMFATVLYRTRLVPRALSAMRLGGAPLPSISTAGIILGTTELGSTFSVLATVPIFFWELSVGLWMMFKGFNRNAPILADAIEPATTLDRVTTAAAA